MGYRLKDLKYLQSTGPGNSCHTLKDLENALEVLRANAMSDEDLIKGIEDGSIPHPRELEALAMTELKKERIEI